MLGLIPFSVTSKFQNTTAVNVPSSAVFIHAHSPDVVVPVGGFHSNQASKSALYVAISAICSPLVAEN